MPSATSPDPADRASTADAHPGRRIPRTTPTEAITLPTAGVASFGEPERTGPLTASSREREVFLSQLLLAAVVLIIVTSTLLLDPAVLRSPLILAGVGLVFLATMVAAIGRWSNWPRWVIMVLPIVDIAAIVMIRNGDAALGAGLLLVFPVTWLAGFFGRTGAIIGPAFASALLWIFSPGDSGPIGLHDLPRLLLLPITLVFISTATYQTARRGAAQRALLTRQSALMTRSYDESREQEGVLDTVLNAVPFAVVAYDATGARTHRNEAFRVLKLRYGSYITAHAEGRLFGADRRTELRADQLPLHRLTRGEEFENEVFWLTSPLAPSIGLAVTGRQLPGGGSVLVQRDITSEMQALRSRDDLIASVSHELRTPLTSVIGYLDLVLDGPELEPAVRRQIEIVLGNSERMLAIVSDLLQAARDSDQAFVLTRNDCDLRQIVADALAAAEPAAADRHVSLSISAPDTVPLVADGFRLRQVVDNLVSNAVKYNRDGGTLTARIDSDEAGVRLSIADTGLGMSDQDRARAFQRFYRSDDMRRSTIHGTGLGLPICRDIIDQHGGSIEVASELGVGTIVTVTLPHSDERISNDL
ncbi:PAS domain-containing sensor histidine kinase [Mycetocola tolaasinivorans]|uniref:histidine kinase n=1 Tax=Mycetocola tolaasinivorans TaxID=76635 RepID=A0A3L7A212_9MICO|nr:ATP-binding protein [Mycetocola tolaasinivorans]RLP74114.1 PAS domain-containing sensor histidine kinase [Mycetocola tolaasinivorans]